MLNIVVVNAPIPSLVLINEPKMKSEIGKKNILCKEICVFKNIVTRDKN